MKLTQAKQDLILAQVLHAKAQTEDSNANINAKRNESYLYATNQLPGRSAEDEENNVSTVAATAVVPVLEISVNNAFPVFRDAFISKGRVAFSYRDRGFRQDAEINNLIVSNINKILLRDNDGKTLLTHAIKEALIAGDPFIKTYIDPKTLTNTDELSDWVDFNAYVSMLTNHWFVDVPAAFAKDRRGEYKGFKWKTVKVDSFDPMSNKPKKVDSRLISGAIPLKLKDDKFKIELVEACNLYVDDSNGNDFSKCRYICHSRETTVGEAELRGFDPEKLKRAADTLKKTELPAVFFSEDFSGRADNREFDSTDPKEMKIRIDEHYIYSSQLHRKNETRPYQVITAGDEFLECNEILEFPFVHGQSETVVGEFWGRSFYDKAKPLQDLKSHQLRTILSNGDQTVKPRYKALKGMYNRESVLQSHEPGAIIEINAPDAVMPFDHLQLSPEYFQAWELVESIENQQLFRGFSSQDLKDISPLSMVTVAMGLAEDAKKSGVVADCLGKTLVDPLINLIYRTMKAENWPIEDDNGQIVKDFVYPETYDIELEVNTSGDDAAKVIQMQAIAGWEAGMSQSQSPVITPQNRYHMVNKMFSLADIDPTNYATDPSTQKDPHAEQEAAQAAFRQSEIHGLAVVKAELENEMLGIQIVKEVQEAEHKEKYAPLEWSIKQQEVINHAQDITAKARAKVDANATAANKVAVDDKRNNLDFVLGTAKAHSEHINRVNGVM
ncbi:hypothetical protein G7D34_003690 [Salmonella enterica]|nr:hypothetical protein [Salmonella enterica]